MISITIVNQPTKFPYRSNDDPITDSPTGRAAVQLTRRRHDKGVLCATRQHIVGTCSSDWKRRGGHDGAAAVRKDHRRVGGGDRILGGGPYVGMALLKRCRRQSEWQSSVLLGYHAYVLRYSSILSSWRWSVRSDMSNLIGLFTSPHIVLSIVLLYTHT